MSKIIKKILNFQKRKNGNISILVLIMSMAIILLTTAMVGYIFHDIGFTELDKGELRALHFAESGLSDMYYKIESESLPEGSTGSFTEYIPDPDNPEGIFEVEYTKVESVEGVLDKYTITSTGTDISSGVTRKVKVEITYINISESLRTGKASGAKEVWGGQTSIIGPFFADTIDDKTTGNTTFKKGPLYVKGDINLSGNASIGEPEGEGYGKIILIQGGGLYYKGKLVEDPLKPPADSKIYVSEYYKAAIDLTFYPIDDIYIDFVKASGALPIEGDLFIGENKSGKKVIMVKSGGRWQEESYPGYLEFNEYGILEIGDIVVNGVIYIGEPPKDLGNASKGKYTIEYSGNGNLISYTDDLRNPGNIFVGNQVIPENNLDYFPENDLMALISQSNINLNLNKADGVKHDKDPNNPKAAAMLFANEEVTTSTNTYFRGGTVSRFLNLGTNTELYYETGIGDYLTGAVPGLGEDVYKKLDIEWQEIIPD